MKSKAERPPTSISEKVSASSSTERKNKNNERNEMSASVVLELAINTVNVAADDNDGDNCDETDAEVMNRYVGSYACNQGPLYVHSSVGDRWELTWPIWHMLPRSERRAIATQHGMKSIGEFEEYISLTRAVDESEGKVEERSGIIAMPSVPSHAGDQREIDVERSIERIAAISIGDSTVVPNAPKNWHPPLTKVIDEEEDDDSSISSSEEGHNTTIQEASKCISDTNVEVHLDIIRLGGLPCTLPDEILHKVFSYLPVDDHATLALVSPHWSRFTRCESLYKLLCQRVYLKQSKRKTLHISRFGNSYRKMLELRPRVRTGGGIYVLKYQEVRKIQRDMWTEIPVGAMLESVYYRYLYFFEDGRVMYALTYASPLEMIPRFSRMLLHGYGSKDKWGVWGNYHIRKDEVLVKVSHDWHDVCFQLRVIPSNKEFLYDNCDRGMYTTIMLEKHMSSASGNFDDNSRDLVKYDISGHSFFRFCKDARL